MTKHKFTYRFDGRWKTDYYLECSCGEKWSNVPNLPVLREIKKEHLKEVKLK